jgi:hypothetical protein
MISGKKSNADKAGNYDFKNDCDETLNAEKNYSDEAPKRLVLLKMEAIKVFCTVSSPRFIKANPSESMLISSYKKSVKSADHVCVSKVDNTIRCGYKIVNFVEIA